MKRQWWRIAIASVCPALLVASGCQSGAPGARFLSFFGLSKEPIVIALMGQPVGDLNPFGPYEPLRTALSEDLDCPVQLRLGLELGLEPNLKLGLYNFAIVTPAVYGGLKEPDTFEIVAVAKGMDGSMQRPSLLVVPAESDINDLEQLRGKTIAFGPLADNRSHLAAVELLKSHGIEKSDLNLPLGALTGTLKHVGPTEDVLNSILAGHSDAGFVDAAEFQALPAEPSDESTMAKSQFRIVGQTIALPDALVIASPKTEPQVVAELKNFLNESSSKRAAALRPLRISGFGPSEAGVRENCMRLRGADTPAAPTGAD